MRRTCVLGMVAWFGLLSCGCTSKKAEIVLVVDNNGLAVYGSKVAFVKDGRRMRANVWLPGTIVIYRIDATTGGGEKATGGSVYRVNARYRIDKIGAFNASKSNEDLVRQYGATPDDKKPGRESKP